MSNKIVLRQEHESATSNTFRNFDRPTDQQANNRGHMEVTYPISKIYLMMFCPHEGLGSSWAADRAAVRGIDTEAGRFKILEN